MNVREIFKPTAIGVNATVRFTAEAVGGFLALTSGTLTIANSAGTSIIVAIPVTSGQFTPIPFQIDLNGGSATTAGGASGYLATT